MSHLLTAGILQQARNLAGGKQYALSFDGVDDYVDCGNLSSTELLAKAEIYIYFPIDYIGEVGFAPIFSRDDDYVFWAGNFTSRISNETLLIRDGAGYTSTFTTDLIVQGWHKIIVEWNGSNYEFYLDDNLMTMDSYNGHSSQMLLDKFFLANRNTSSQFGDIKISYIRITGDTGELLEYKIDTGTGNTLFDKSGNENHGTIYGATWIEI